MRGPFSIHQISPRRIFGAYVPFIQMIFPLIAALILGANQDGRMIASTDEGELLLFKCSKGMGG